MKARLGLKRAKGQLALAIARIDEAVYLAGFDINYLGDEAQPADKEFHHRLTLAQKALQAVASAAQ